MSFLETLAKIGKSVMKTAMEEGAKRQARETEAQLKEAGHVSARGEVLYGGRTLSEWNRMWESIGPLASAHLTPYNRSVGLYRHWYQGRVVYIGRAIELHNGGFRKRLSDYRRDSDSGRKHTSGQRIYNHLNDITTDVLVVGNDEEAVEWTKRLEAAFISREQPEWNAFLK